jgi:phosphonate transport system substrate-binding protein
VIVPRDSYAESFDELRGKCFAFTDPYSHTGRAYPAYLIAQQGDKVDGFFGKSFFTYSHDRAIEAVAQGLADGASVDSLVYDFLMALKPDLISRTRILQVSQPFGAPPIVTGSKIQPEWRKRIQEALLRMGEDPEGRAILDRLRVDQFIIPSSDLYEEAHRVWDAARSQ